MRLSPDYWGCEMHPCKKAEGGRLGTVCSTPVAPPFARPVAPILPAIHPPRTPEYPLFVSGIQAQYFIIFFTIIWFLRYIFAKYIPPDNPEALNTSS